MFRFCAQIFSGIIALFIAICVVVLALSNRAIVSLDMLPLPYQVELPMYLVMALCFIAGLSVGLVLYIGLRIKLAIITRKLRRQIVASNITVKS